MFKKLQQKWNVSPRRVWVILAAFAIGGSLCGFLGKKLMTLINIDKGSVYLLCYLIMITLLWPICVVLIGSILGEYDFFSNYLLKISRRLSGRSTNEKIRLAIFASGGGSNAEKIIQYFSAKKSKRLSVELIVSNCADAGVVSKALTYNISSTIINNEDLKNPHKLIKTLAEKNITHIILAGFLRKMPMDILEAFPNKIINIHPALLPNYGGKGMYGHFVHEAVKANKDKETGISIHLVNEAYDEGKLIFQKACTIEEHDTAEVIAAKVLNLEHKHYAPVIEDWLLK